MTTVQRMAFVWSRLALAAVLAAGAACAPAEACPEPTAAPEACECDGPRLVCAEGASFVLLADGHRGHDDAVAAGAPSAAITPRSAFEIAGTRLPAPPPTRGDVLAVAPKTSPPRT